MLPSPKISRDQWKTFLQDPEVITLEVLFILLTLSNIFILYRILLDIAPFPIFVTWFQLLMGFLFALIFGFIAVQFPRCAFFPPFTFDFSFLQSLLCGTLVYIGMITFANILLNLIPSVASFPVAASLALVFHHVSRFLGCGQIYLPIRWIALAIMLAGFIIGCLDPLTIGATVIPIALAYSLCSSVFRAWCLEKAMHSVEGHGNTLHNHQVVVGLVVLLPISFLFGEGKIFGWMPCDFSKLNTWQSWGVLVVSGTIPLLKNIVANRLIRRTGQAPWRILEVVTMILLFGLGALVWDTISIAGFIAFICVLIGRIIASADALSFDPKQRHLTIREEPMHESELPSALQSPRNDSLQHLYSQRGMSDGFHYSSLNNDLIISLDDVIEDIELTRTTTRYPYNIT